MTQYGLEADGQELPTLPRADTATAAPDTAGGPRRSPPAPGRHRGVTATTVRGARRPRISSPVLQGLIALAIYLAVWLSYAPVRDMLFHPPFAPFDTPSNDPGFFVWMLRWWPYTISHLIDPLHTNLISAPGASFLAWTTTVPVFGVLAAPLTAVAGPVVTFNLLNALAIPLTAWATFVFCRRLTGQFWPSLVGGTVFGFSAFEIYYIPGGDLDLTYGLLLPVIGYLVLRWWQGDIGRVTFAVLAGLAIAGQFYISLETFTDLTALLVAALAVGFLLAGPAVRAQVARLAGLLAVAYGIALVLAAPYLYGTLQSVPSSSVFVVQTHPLNLATLKPDIPLFVVAVALALLRWSSRLTRYLVVMLVVIIAAALGPALTIGGHQYFGFPWSWIWKLPLLRDAFPNRLITFAYLVLALITALFLAGWAKNIRKFRWQWLVAPAVVAVMVFNMTAGAPATVSAGSASAVPALISSGQYHRVLAPGETVVVISRVGNAGMLWQAETDFYFRLAGGYVGYAFSPRGGSLPAPIRGLSGISVRNTAHVVGTFRSFVVSARVGAILVDARYKPWWVGIFSKIGLRGRVVGGVLVYPTDGCRACVDPLGRHGIAGH